MLWKIVPLFLRLLCRCFPVNLMILFQDPFIREHLRANCLCNFEVHRILNNKKKTNKQRLAQLCLQGKCFSRYVLVKKYYIRKEKTRLRLVTEMIQSTEAGHRSDPIKANDFITLLNVRRDSSMDFLLKRILIVNILVFLQLFVWIVRDSEKLSDIKL